jgi:hypothetical protein
MRQLGRKQKELRLPEHKYLYTDLADTEVFLQRRTIFTQVSYQLSLALYLHNTNILNQNLEGRAYTENVDRKN